MSQYSVSPMKLSIRLTLISLIFFHLLIPSLLSSHSNDTVSLKLENIPLRTALEMLVTQTEIDIVYGDKLIENVDVTCDFHNIPLDKALKRILDGTSVVFKIFNDNQVVLIWRDAKKNKTTLRGRLVDDEDGVAIDNANVFLANTTMGSASNVMESLLSIMSLLELLIL